MERMTKRRILQGLKLIGIGIFLWIVYNINVHQLLSTLSNTNPILIGLAFLSLIGLCLAKTTRWHFLVLTTDYTPTFSDSWRLFFVGLFLGNMTPGKIGELIRANYLSNQGVPLKIGILLTIIDRICDVVIIIVLSILSFGILGWIQWSWIINSILFLALSTLLLIFIRKHISICTRLGEKYSLNKFELHSVALVLLWTIVGWIFYFMWAVFLAHSIGIIINIPVLVASFSITGLLSMLPIAPSGLGTRDAALVVLLTPYGIATESSVALALLMFISILFVSTLGGWYWLHNDPPLHI